MGKQPGATFTSSAATVDGEYALRLRVVKVLIVDDEELVLKAVAHVAKAAGCIVTAMTDSAAARALLLGGEHFDVVITDNKMPGVSGLDICAAAPAAAVVVLMTGDGVCPAAPKRVLVLPKPMPLQTLRDLFK